MILTAVVVLICAAAPLALLAWHLRALLDEERARGDRGDARIDSLQEASRSLAARATAAELHLATVLRDRDRLLVRAAQAAGWDLDDPPQPDHEPECPVKAVPYEVAPCRCRPPGTTDIHELAPWHGERLEAGPAEQESAA